MTTSASADTVPARGLLRGALFHYGRYLGNGPRALHAVRDALAATPDERVLDFGCGSGGFCRAVPGDYLGIDLDPDYVAFARWRWGGPRRRFAVTALEDLPPDARFDGAIMVNALHHLSDETADAVLARLGRLVRRRLVVVDADPDASNALQAFLLARDRGDWIRPRARQRAILAGHFTVTREDRFRNTVRTLVQTLFVCEPRA